MLGVHQGHANGRDNQVDKALENNHTLGNVLQQLGYATVAVGKWGLQGTKKGSGQPSGLPAGNESLRDAWPAFPLNRGFDQYFGYVRHRDGHEHYPKEGLYRQPTEVTQGGAAISVKLDKYYNATLLPASHNK